MMEQFQASQELSLSDEERLRLQQLRLLEWIENRQAAAQHPSATQVDSPQPELKAPPERWELTRDVDLYEWQQECVRAWFDAGARGTVKVVTGGGKTLLALAIAEKLQQERDPNLRVAIVVPTIVLMNQWYEELQQHSNLPMETIARMGGGYAGDFGDGRRVLIAVLASGYKFLPSLVDENIGRHLLFIADECHRAGAKEMSKVLSAPRAYSLGLSATPEREEEDEETQVVDDYATSLLGKQLGGVVYELTLARAVELGVIPRFTIRHYGLPMNEEEALKYERLSRSIEDARKELQHMGTARRGAGIAFYRWVRSLSDKGETRGSGLATRFLMDTRERKDLLYRIESRQIAVEELLRREFDMQPRARAILFHESIDAVMRLFNRLRLAGFDVVAEHSDLPDSYREQSLDLFRRGTAKVIVSAKSLIEGFNVPAADVGIIVASSTSVRQRIQSLGRVLRKHRGLHGEEKTSVIHVLYAEGTVDDAIYAKTNWEDFTGAERNEYFRWDPPGSPVPQEGPPRKPPAKDVDIDVSQLGPGDDYSGDYEGREFTSDTQGNVRDMQGRYAKNPGAVPVAVRSVKGTAGRFRVTPKCGYVLVRVPDEEGWTTKYVTHLGEPFQFGEVTAKDAELAWCDHAKWLSTAAPGAEYPFPPSDAMLRLNYRQRRGGVIAKRVPNGEVYARVGADAKDPARGGAGTKLLEACRKLQNQGALNSQFEVNQMGDAVCRSSGRLLFIAAIPEGLEFPDTE